MMVNTASADVPQPHGGLPTSPTAAPAPGSHVDPPSDEPQPNTGAGSSTPPEPAATETDEEARAEVDAALVDDSMNLSVVTASGSEESRSLASANVTTVTWAEISRRGYRSVAEVLQDQIGLYVIDDHVTQSVGVRGVTGGLRGGTRIVRIMINGVPVSFRPDLTAFLDQSYIPFEAIERIEIAKGPLSALYGANAFLATINIVTRSQSGGSPTILEVAGHVDVVGGNVGQGASGVVGYEGEDYFVFAAASFGQVDRSGLTIEKTFAQQDPANPRYQALFAGPSQRDLARPLSAYFQLRRDLTKSRRVWMQGGIQRVRSDGEFQLNSALTHQSVTALQNIWASAHYEDTWSREDDAGRSRQYLATRAWAAVAQGAPTDSDQLYLTGNHDTSFARHFEYSSVDLNAEVEGLPTSSLSLKGGADFSYEAQQVLWYTQTLAGVATDLIANDEQRRVDLSNFGVFAQAVFAPAKGLRLTANARLDAPSEYDPQVSWRTAGAYRFSRNVTAKVIAGRAFQTPSAVMLFGLPGFGNQNNVIGNRTLTDVVPLQPQVVESTELDTLLRFENVSFEVGLFGQRVDDKVEFLQQGSQFRAANQGRTESVGVEATAAAVAGRFTANLGGSLLRPVIDGGLDSQPIPLYPNAMAVAAAEVRIPEAYVTLNARVRAVGDRGASQSNILLNNDTPYALPGYFTTDVTLTSMGLNLGDVQTTFTAKIQNVLDKRYSEPGFGGFDIPALGRTFFVELRGYL